MRGSQLARIASSAASIWLPPPCSIQQAGQEGHDGLRRFLAGVWLETDRASDLARLRVSVSYDLPGLMTGDGHVAGVRISLKAPGVASVTIPAGNYDTSDGNFEIEAHLSRIPDGRFVESKTLAGSQIW